jgi:hypothetical protein
MTKHEKDLIKAFALKQIGKDDFFAEYPVDLNIDKVYALKTLEGAYESKNSEDIEYGLLLGFLLNLFSSDYIDVLCKLILEKWHYKHEDIALILQELKNPKSIDCLYQAALMKFDYLSYDDSYALARKCIHALGDINTEYSREKLRLLASSDIPIIKEKAEKQLHYYPQ